jgi:hypothetical protein
MVEVDLPDELVDLIGEQVLAPALCRGQICFRLRTVVLARSRRIFPADQVHSRFFHDFFSELDWNLELWSSAQQPDDAR